ncbi:MAG: hypothetical protein AAF804_14930 [Bacteroidota bacterium]
MKTPLPLEVLQTQGEVVFSNTHLLVNLPRVNRSILLQIAGESLPLDLEGLHVGENYAGFGLGHAARVDLSGIEEKPLEPWCKCLLDGADLAAIKVKDDIKGEGCHNGGVGAISCSNTTIGHGPCHTTCGEGYFGCCNPL